MYASCRPVGTYTTACRARLSSDPVKVRNSPVACGVPLHQSGFTIAELTALVYPKPLLRCREFRFRLCCRFFAPRGFPALPAIFPCNNTATLRITNTSPEITILSLTLAGRPLTYRAEWCHRRGNLHCITPPFVNQMAGPLQLFLHKGIQRHFPLSDIIQRLFPQRGHTGAGQRFGQRRYQFPGQQRGVDMFAFFSR